MSGSDIEIDAIEDPKVQGVTCHVSCCDRGLIDRVRNGEFFSDPSSSSIACRQTGPIVIGDIARDAEGEGGGEVFSQRTFPILKSVKVTRIHDQEHETPLDPSHATEVKGGSAGVELSTLPPCGENVICNDRRSAPGVVFLQ